MIKKRAESLFSGKKVYGPYHIIKVQNRLQNNLLPKKHNMLKKCNAQSSQDKKAPSQARIDDSCIIYVAVPQLTKALDNIKGVLLLDLHITICTLKSFVPIFPSLAKSATNIR